jgi:hypothetical protein
MKKIPIDFEYNLPDRSEFYKMTTREVRNALDKERKRFESYIKDTESEINSMVERLTKGTNVIEDDALFEDENEINYGETKFAYIGEKNQNKIKQINAIYKEIKNGIDVYNTISENKMFGDLNKDIILSQGVLPDVIKLNNIIKFSGFNLVVNYKNLLSDENHYDEDVFLILKAIENQRSFNLITN